MTTRNDLARKALEASAKREAELAAMSPRDRAKAIRKWARRLARGAAKPGAVGGG
jgi:hypothetical protein